MFANVESFDGNLQWFSVFWFPSDPTSMMFYDLWVWENEPKSTQHDFLDRTQHSILFCWDNSFYPDAPGAFNGRPRPSIGPRRGVLGSQNLAVEGPKINRERLSMDLPALRFDFPRPPNAQRQTKSSKTSTRRPLQRPPSPRQAVPIRFLRFPTPLHMDLGEGGDWRSPFMVPFPL